MPSLFNKLTYVSLSRWGVLITLYACMAFSPAIAAETTACKMPAGKPVFEMFRDLQNVGLVIKLPQRYKRAVQCHGTEESCSNSIDELAGAPNRREALKIQLINDYKSYPSSFHANKVTDLFKKRIEEQLSHYLRRGSNCEIPELTILDESRSEYFFTKDPSALSVRINLEILESTKPRIATLSMQLHRANYSGMPHVWVTAIPLDLPQNEIEKLLVQFANSFAVTNTLAFE